MFDPPIEIPGASECQMFEDEVHRLEQQQAALEQQLATVTAERDRLKAIAQDAFRIGIKWQDKAQALGDERNKLQAERDELAHELAVIKVMAGDGSSPACVGCKVIAERERLKALKEAALTHWYAESLVELCEEQCQSGIEEAENAADEAAKRFAAIVGDLAQHEARQAAERREGDGKQGQ